MENPGPFWSELEETCVVHESKAPVEEELKLES